MTEQEPLTRSERLARLEGRLDRLDERLAAVEVRLLGEAPVDETAAPAIPVSPAGWTAPGTALGGALWGSTVTPARAAVEAPASVGDRRCGRCGKPISPYWKGKCNHCGVAFAEVPPVSVVIAGARVAPAAPPAPAAEPVTAAAEAPVPIEAAWLTAIKEAIGWTPGGGWSLQEIEQRVTGRLLAWVGGAAVLIGVIFFLSLAFSSGWVGPELRVLIGLAGGALFIAGSAWLFERGQALLGHVLVAVGLGTISLALLAATRLYGLVPAELALAGSLLSMAAATVIAIRAGSQAVAAFGVVAMLAAPPLLGAPASLATIGFLGTALAATTAIALFRSWSWLPSLAFILTAPQLAVWILGHPDRALGLAGVVAFWALSAVAAGGEEFRHRRGELRVSSAPLLVANAAFLVGAGFLLLDGDATPLRGLFLALVALAHFVLGGYFLRAEGELHPFGMLAVGTGVTAVTMAIPVQFGGPVVALAWAAEAVALAWVFGTRDHRYAGIVAAVLGTLAVAHLVAIEYPVERLIVGLGHPAGAMPFVNGAGLTLGFLLGGLAVAGIFVRSASIRIGLGAAGFALVAYALPFELSGPPLAIGWVAEAVTLAWIRGDAVRFPADARGFADVGGIVLGILGIGHFVLVEYPLWKFSGGGTTAVGAIPFVNGSGLTLALLLVALAAAAYLARSSPVRAALASVGLLLVAYALPFELSGMALLAGWSGLAVLAVALQASVDLVVPRVAPRAGFERARALYLPAILGGVLALADLLNSYLPPGEIGREPLPQIPFVDERSVAAAVAIGAMLLAAFVTRVPAIRAGAIVAATVTAAYLAPFELPVFGVVIGWSALALALALPIRWDRPGARLYTVAAATLAGLGLAVTLTLVAPPARLAVGAGKEIDHPLLLSEASAALAGLIVLAAAGSRRFRGRREGTALAVAGGALAVYLLSIGVVDAFQARLGGPVALEELQKQAQVALSILWAVVGVGAFGGGVLRGLALVREFGLALLALATLKVFVFDLAALDVSYRVLSFIGLGILLLVSAYVYQSLRPGRHGKGGAAPSH